MINELGGFEKIDIIQWSKDIKQFIISSLAPAHDIELELDEKKKTAVATVPDDQLSLAIGKEGQNVRLAAKLSGFKIDIKGKTSGKTKTAEGEREKEEKEKTEKVEKADEKKASDAPKISKEDNKDKAEKAEKNAETRQVNKQEEKSSEAKKTKKSAKKKSEDNLGNRQK